MLKKSEWMDLASDLDWQFTYVSEKEVFPSAISGSPWLDFNIWKKWDEPFKTSFIDYVIGQSAKDEVLASICESVGQLEDYKKLDALWLNALKLYSATFSLAEFAATIGNLRAARFGRTSHWRNAALFGGMDELRHTQIPLLLMHGLLPHDSQFDWTHKFYHSNNWVAIAARHMIDELLLCADPIEFAIATNFVFETGFTNLQFVGLSSLAHHVGDKIFSKMINSIQSDEVRHSQIGPATLKIFVQHDKEKAQALLDKWLWRNWLIFAVVTGFSMDYLTPLEHRKYSFKEFMEEWILGQFAKTIDKFGLKKPWYWDIFLQSIETYHHMVYASAYTYRSTVWFDFVVPGPNERKWLKEKYAQHWDEFDPIWERVSSCWQEADVDNDFAVHGTAIVTFCNLCQLVLSGGTPKKNSSTTLEYKNQKYIFCSDPCKKIFENEPEKYCEHKDIVKKVLAGEAPGNVIALIRDYFGLDFDTWGKDIYGGRYEWLKKRSERGSL